MNDLFGYDSDEIDGGSTQQPSMGNKVRVAVEAIIPSVGGGRGLVAKTNVPAGTLILAETAILIWPPDMDHGDPLSLLEMAHMVLQSDIAMKAVQSMFPKSIHDVEQIELENIRSHVGAELSSYFPDIEEFELLRILLVIQHNGFKSGFYHHVTLLNHSCQPNCIKFNPSNNSAKISEIWTTKPVLAGEEFVICYYSPYETSRSSATKYLNDNHHFVCSCTKCCNVDTLSTSAITDTSIENEIIQIEFEFQTLQIHQIHISNRILVRMYSSLENILLKIDSNNISIDMIMMKARVLKFLISLLILIFEQYDKLKMKKYISKILLITNKENYAISYLKYSLELLQLQLIYLSDKHPDIGSTYVDIACGIEGILHNYTITCLQNNFSNYEWIRNHDMALKMALDYRNKGNEIVRMYSISKNYPEVLKLRTPGEVYWGEVSL